MELWKTRPDLDATLMRSVNYCNWRTSEEINQLNQHYLRERDILWYKSDICRNSAAAAIQESFTDFLFKRETSYKKLNFSKNDINDDLISEICKHL